MPAELIWRVHRARENPGKTVAVVIFILVLLGFSLVYFGLVLALLAALILFVALNAYFLPITVRFSDGGIDIDKRLFRTHYDWGQFRKWYRTTGGIVLSPFAHKTYLNNFRGVHLLLPEDPSPIIAYLEQRFAPQQPDDRLRLDDQPEDKPQNPSPPAGSAPLP